MLKTHSTLLIASHLLRQRVWSYGIMALYKCRPIIVIIIIIIVTSDDDDDDKQTDGT